MKREFKFKFWDTKNNEMHYDNVVIHGKNGFVFFGEETESRDYIEKLEYLPVFDKKGVQYCDGDLVKTSFGNLIVRFGTSKGVIGWSLFESMKSESGCAIINDDYLIIGNIYENPELL